MQSLEASIQNAANNNLVITQQLAAAAQQEQVVEQQMNIIDGITAEADKATLYKKVFGDCCDVPQSCGCGGDCGCSDETPA